MSYSITKTGQLCISEAEEYIYEPDGSIWKHVFHHNNPATNKFASSDPFTTGVYKNNDMWFNLNICNELSSWEFIYAQCPIVGGAIAKYRWTQTANPFTATYDNVKPGTVTYNTSTGYVNSTMGGLYKLNNNTFFVVANSNNGSWWGAIGSWTTYDGGIPGHPQSTQTIKSGYIDIYIRVDSITNYTNISKLGIITTKELYEY